MAAKIRPLLLLSLILVPWLNAQKRPIAFVDVSVVPMDKEQVLPHQTVVVLGGRITEVASAANAKVPRGSVRIDGRGKFLMPGLADMHVHFMRPTNTVKPQFSASNNLTRPTGTPASASSDYERENRALALLFVANGVTSVRNMWGNAAIDGFAKEIGEGMVLGPHIYSTGPITDGNPPSWAGSRMVETREQAEEAVRSDKQAGYIALKVYNRLSKEGYEALVAAAHEQDLPVVGHVPDAVGLLGAIAAHQDSVEHLQGFWEAMQPGDSADKNKSSADLLRQSDTNKLPAIVQAVKAAGMWNCPTLVLYDLPKHDAAWLSQKSLMPAAILERYKSMYPNTYSNPRNSPEGHALNLAIVSALYKGGAHLLLGTDTVKPGTLPGFSLHDELAYFVAAGMTPYNAIRSGTSEAAKFLRQQNEFGLVATGLRADLLLVEANPLEDVNNISRLAGVMVNGQWLSKKEIQRQLTILRKD
jgi:imidazolonepropionase-like amidohydrolase